MRLWLVLPREGRGRGLGALALRRALAASGLLAAAALAGCGATSATLAPPAPPAPQRLAIGITEPNPHLIAAGAQPAAFAPWRDRLAALRPTYVRVVLDWTKAGTRESGCMRAVGPCAPYDGLRDVLRALASRRIGDPGRWQPLLTIQGVPDRYALPAGGCERSDANPRARAITAEGLRAYARLLAGALALARAEGAPIRAVSPWNEPNHPSLISPQRSTCDRDAPSHAARVYAQLVRAARPLLGDAQLVLGELAGYTDRTPRTTTIGELVANLPDDVACAAAAWSVHDYAQATSSSTDAVAALEHALGQRSCTSHTPIWITETGGGRRRGRRAGVVAACRAIAERLDHWAADPRIAAVFQYTFREDPAFPVGLADAGLTRLYPAYRLWRAWSDLRPGAANPTPRVCA